MAENNRCSCGRKLAKHKKAGDKCYACEGPIKHKSVENRVGGLRLDRFFLKTRALEEGWG